jgi:hypothetical protein
MVQPAEPQEEVGGGRDEGDSEGWRRAMKTMTVIVLAAFAVCVLAVILAVLLVPSLAWADVLGWLTTTPPCEAPCD